MIEIRTCIISFFSCLHAQNSVVWANEKCVWWQTNVNSVKQRGAQTAHSIWSSTKQNQKNKSKQNIRILKDFFFSFPKWKYFILEVLCELFKWKVIPFQFFPWTTKVFFSLPLILPSPFPLSQKIAKEEQRMKTMEKKWWKIQMFKSKQ